MLEKVSSNSASDDFVYEVYAYKHDPENDLYRWLKYTTEEEMLHAREKARSLYKTKLYERIEIQQKPACNSNTASPKIIRTYKKHDHALLGTSRVQIFVISLLSLIFSFLMTYTFLL